MKKNVRWAVMGLGLQGNRLIKAIQASRHASVAATASEREGGSLARALKDKTINAVAVATPNNMHAAHVIAAARAGKHVLCEKPLALSMPEVRRIEQAVRINGVRCFVNYHLRMHPEAQRARKLLAQKKLGDPTFIEMHWSIGGLAQKDSPPLPRHMRWRESPEQSGGGALMARGVHLFDLLRFLTGEEIREVRGWSDATSKTVDKTAIAVCILNNGTPAVLTTSKAIPHADNRVTIHGTRGRLELRDVFTDDPQPMYKRVFDSCAEAVRGKKTPLATLEDGAAAVAAAEAFTKSARSQKIMRMR